MKIGMRLLTLGTVGVLLQVGVLSAEETATFENVVSPGSIRPDEPLRQEFSLDAAAKYLDAAAQAWQREKRCFACHTDYPYLLARPAMSRGLAIHDEIRSALEERVDDPKVKDPGPHQNSESVMVAAVLAHNDAATTGKLHPLTRKALDRMWTLQSENGGWIWQKRNRPPSGVDDYFGTALAAVAAGVAPDKYSETAPAQEGLKRIRSYFENNPPANLHNRAMLLWVSTYVDDLLSESERREVIDGLLALQRPDGGWAFAGLGNWKRSDGKEQETESSDGYGTGFVIYVLRRGGVPSEDPRIQEGVAWLKAHQRASGRWFTRSATRDTTHYISNAGTAFAVRALAACGEVDGTILETAGVKGGLVVHLGCGDGRQTAGLYAGDGYLVHGLDTDAGQVAEAREHIRSLGLYGKVSVDTFDGRRLPYVDNLVNLVVAEDLGEVSMDEVMRVLAPLGVVWVGGKKIIKPWPKGIDEWTHFLHGADNNAMAKDTVVGPPKRYQWISGPRWARSHDHLSSLSAMVSAKGRLFAIIDEAPAASVAFAPEWRLVARDAFSGVLLWKRAIGPWEGHFRPFRTGPTALARRLVAVGDRVYVTLGYGKPVSILDAATGETIRECEQTARTMEIAVHEGMLFAVVGDREPFEPEDTGKWSVELEGTGKTSGSPEEHWKVWREKAPQKHLVAVDAESGTLHWKKDDSDTRQIMPTAMAVSGGRVFFQNEKAILALDAGTGKELWRQARPVNLDAPGSSAPTLVASGGVVICADREVGTAPRDEDEQGRSAQWHLFPHTAHSRGGEAIAYDAATGDRLWSVTSVENFRAPADVFVRGNLAFVRSNEPGLTAGMNLRTGQVEHLPQKRSPIRDPGTHWRCYRNKATEKYLVLCEINPSDTAFYDLDTGARIEHHFVRGSCQYGLMPSNGLLYAPHHSCACAVESKLSSFNALAPNANPAAEDVPETVRLQRGPAYGSISAAASSDATAGDWPTYRHDAARSGVAGAAVGAELTPEWETRLDGRLTAPVVADGVLMTAAPECHAVHALNAESGEPMWSFATGGAVDSPPTLHRGAAIFGCADGWIYCLRASDGELAWRYRAAPMDRRIVAYGQVESVWPVHGSVLVQDDVVYAAAGRTTHMDGLYFLALDASTGRELVRKRITRALFPDVLSSDGTNIFMRQKRLDKQGAIQPGGVPHLFSSAGFLDDTWWHRTYWQFGAGMSGGYTRWFAVGQRRPAGRLMVVDRERIFGFGRLNQYDHVGSHVGLGKMRYSLYAARRSDFATPAREAKRTPGDWKAKKPDIPTLWQRKINLLARGMVLCEEVLFVAGPPDVFGVAPGETPHPYTPAAARSLRSQREALEGKKGSLLWAVAADNGEKLSEARLDGLPAWDGLIASGDRLYLTMQDGAVRCFSGEAGN